MLFWIFAGVMTLIVAMVLALPLFATRRLKPDEAFALEIYRDQLSELTRDEARGLLSPEQARAAQIEIERRILALDSAPQYRRAEPPAKWLTLSMAVLLPLGAFAFYLALGEPQLRGLPLAERETEFAQRTSPESIQLENKVAANPSDAGAWADLGHAYARLDRARDAADAFAKAIALGAASPENLVEYAHAIVLSENGMVTTQAREALARATAAEPTHPMARFFLALAKAQDGDVAGALTDWLAIEAELAPDSNLRPTLDGHIEKAARQLGLDPAALPERTRNALAGPSDADVAAAAQMSAAERDAFIRDMVEGLAKKLRNNPDDVEGWARLARAYGVIDELPLARAAWAQAARLAPARLDLQLEWASALIRGQTDLDKGLPDGFAEAVGRIRTLDPAHPLGLFYAGMLERAAGRNDAAKELWLKVLALLPEGSKERDDLQRQIDELAKANP